MISFEQKLTQDLVIAAYGFEELRNNSKKYLSQFDMNYDKFTVVSHDSFIGYITEYFLREYIGSKYKSEGVTVESWESIFDIAKIRSILKSNSKATEDVQYIRDYFYDKYDLKLSKGAKSLLVDIKTALTKLEPKSSWNFMYPVIQANKPGKDHMVLSYYVVEDIKDIESLKKLVIVGYTSEEVIRTCKIIKAGTRTRFGTVSQIDNYETELAIHYKDIDRLINLL
jgi:hypothetical protein